MSIPKIRGWGFEFSRGGEEEWEGRGSGAMGGEWEGMLQTSFKLLSLLLAVGWVGRWRVVDLRNWK